MANVKRKTTAAQTTDAAPNIHMVGKSTIKALGFLGVGGGVPCAVDYKDGKIIRIRPFYYD
jgi:hypothetical protein